MTAANPTADPADQAPAKAAPAVAAPPGPPPAYPPLKGTALLLGTLSLSLATFMNVLDSSIANVSIPAIAGDLGVSPGQGTWVITSFGVANAISVPLTGWLTQRFGAVRLFTMSVLLFVLTSSSFVYVALADLIPQLQKRLSARETAIQVVWLLLGMAVVMAVSRVAHHAH